MACRQSHEYNEAIQNLSATAGDEELRQGEPDVNMLGVPAPFSGGCKIHCPLFGPRGNIP